MRKLPIALLLALCLAFLCYVPSYAQSYTIPITVGSSTYTLTVTINQGALAVDTVTSGATVGAVLPVRAAATPGAKATPVVTPVAAQDDTARMASAISLPYDDLYRYNEEHVGKFVRYVGEVAQYMPGAGADDSAVLRVNVSALGYGLWGDTIWVEYAGGERYLEDDIVTLWGTVEGLQSYTGVLGNLITLPSVKAVVIKLGDLPNPAAAGLAGSTGSTGSTGSAGGPAAAQNGNLRTGPGTSYALAGSVAAGAPLKPVEQTADGSWLKLDTGAWIAAFLVANVPASLPVATALPTPVATAPPAAPAAAPAAPAPAEPTAAPAESKSIYAMGEAITGSGWTFKVLELHKRKTVYFYDESDFAMGNFLIVVVEATNNQSGTDYFDNNVNPWLTDQPGNTWSLDGATGYARWQYGGLDSVYTDVDPGQTVRVGLAFDLPPETGKVLLSTQLPAWVDLGDFSALPLED